MVIGCMINKRSQSTRGRSADGCRYKDCGGRAWEVCVWVGRWDLDVCRIVLVVAVPKALPGYTDSG